MDLGEFVPPSWTLELGILPFNAALSFVGYDTFDAFRLVFDLAAVPENPPSWTLELGTLPFNAGSVVVSYDTTSIFDLFVLYVILLLSRRFLHHGWL